MIVTFALAAVLGASALETSSPAEAAAMARLAPAFQGAIVDVYPDGRRGHLYLNADKTYRYSGRTGTKSSGVWNLDADAQKVCLRQRAPVALPLHYCTGIPSGPTWSAKAQTGEVLTVHVEPGRKG